MQSHAFIAELKTNALLLSICRTTLSPYTIYENDADIFATALMRMNVNGSRTTISLIIEFMMHPPFCLGIFFIRYVTEYCSICT